MLYSFIAWKENNETTSICRWHESRILLHKTLWELIDNSVKSLDARSTYKNQLYFCIPATNMWKPKLKYNTPITKNLPASETTTIEVKNLTKYV